MHRFTIGAVALVALSGCIVMDDGVFFDDGRFDTGFSAEENCLRWQPGVVNLVDGLTQASLDLSNVCEFPVQVMAVTLDDPDAAFAIDLGGAELPRTFEPGSGVRVELSFVATDGAAHEGQLLSELESFDTDVRIAAVAQLYGQAAE